MISIHLTVFSRKLNSDTLMLHPGNITSRETDTVDANAWALLRWEHVIQIIYRSNECDCIAAKGFIAPKMVIHFIQYCPRDIMNAMCSHFFAFPSTHTRIYSSKKFSFLVAVDCCCCAHSASWIFYDIYLLTFLVFFGRFFYLLLLMFHFYTFKSKRS